MALPESPPKVLSPKLAIEIMELLAMLRDVVAESRYVRDSLELAMHSRKPVVRGSHCLSSDGEAVPHAAIQLEAPGQSMR